MISKILVPTDGSKTAQKAAAYAIGLAKQLHASIIVMCVVDKLFHSNLRLASLGSGFIRRFQADVILLCRHVSLI